VPERSTFRARQKRPEGVFFCLRRKLGKAQAKRLGHALQDNCVIFHTKIVSADAPSHLPFCHDARYSQVSFGAGPE
jgi:hypothetical protein